MAFDNLRSFLQALDEQGQLLKIEEEVNAEPDLAAADEHHRLWQNHAISMGLPANTPVKSRSMSLFAAGINSRSHRSAGPTHGRRIRWTVRRLTCSTSSRCFA